MLTHERLLEVLEYCSWSGLFRWKIQRHKVNKGQVAGYRSKLGYMRIGIDGEYFRSCRLAWFYVHGKWPKDIIDHKDGVKYHDWIDNLREANTRENNWNKGRTSRNRSGFKGVSVTVKGKFTAYLCLGTYETAEEAYEVYKEAAIKLHGEFAHSSLTSDVEINTLN